MRYVKRVLFSKIFAFIILALLQIAFFIALVLLFAKIGVIAYIILTIITVLVLVFVLEQDELNPAYKLMWTLIIASMPVFGALFYSVWGHHSLPQRHRRHLLKLEHHAEKTISKKDEILPVLKKENKHMAQIGHYLLHYADAPLYVGHGVEYYPIGETFFPPFLEAIRGAKKYVFMEYFIYQEGYMLDTTIDILRQKAAEGVDVRILFDGLGSLFTLPANYEKKLQGYGIDCRAFMPLAFTPHLSNYAMLNHRDHRKIAVIDGEIGFSGGLNFSDEYINVVERFGEWKDTAFMLRGDAVFSLAVTFLKTWDFVAKTQTNYEEYRLPPQPALPPSTNMMENGLVQPYCDSPLDMENVSENVYLKIITGAEDYVYISTPYLILDHEMITCLTLASKSGVDVRILTPGIPDKSTVFTLTQSYYPVLLKAGVRIYEFTPGFNHAKMYVSDDKIAIVGSANMDYRSLYLHFENCVSFYGGKIVDEAKQDMIESFARSREITLEDTKNISLWKRLVQVVARFLAPLM